jgi:HK97 family phage major capsid protein
MTKRMRELQAKMQELNTKAKGYMAEGEGRDLDKAKACFDQIDALQEEFDLEARAEKAAKAGIPDDAKGKPAGEPEKASGLKAMTKLFKKQRLTDAEKAMLSGDNAENGENLLIPEDVRAEINELRKTYVSARDIVTVETTDALAGSVNYEDGDPAELIDFTDGDEISASDEPKIVPKKFSISFKGALIPISRILLGSEKGGLLGYLNRWFVRKAILTENKKIFATLKAGYNEGAPKAIAGWKGLKKSINVDLDPSVKLQGVIVTNQSGFAVLDEEEDNNGRPILQPNPANPTEKVFQGLVVKVFPDAQLPNIDATHYPVIYGATKAGATFVEHTGLEFNVSEHYLFGKNQNCMRVIEGFDVMSTDTSAYIYGSFTATTKA